MKNIFLAFFAVFLSIMPVHAEVQAVKGLPKIPGLEGPILNVVDGKILVSIKLLFLELEAGAGLIIPKTKQSRVDLMQNILDGGTIVQFTIDPNDIKGVTAGKDPNLLPDGRAIPGSATGTLPSLRVDTKFFNTSYYFAPTLFAIYVPFDIDTRGLSGSATFKLGSKAAGGVTLVSSNAQGKNAALFIHIKKAAMEGLEAKVAESLKNPGVVY